MRPTLSISHWKIAVDLENTRRIQRSPGMLATDCECDQCSNWRMVFDEVLPDDLLKELARVGISPGYPSDCYGYGPEEGVEKFRVWFHAVGKILSGPSGWIETEIGGQTSMARKYVAMREKPYPLSLVIQRASEFCDQPPALDDVDLRTLIQIDFRATVPFRVT